MPPKHRLTEADLEYVTQRIVGVQFASGNIREFTLVPGDTLKIDKRTGNIHMKYKASGDEEFVQGKYVEFRKVGKLTVRRIKPEVAERRALEAIVASQERGEEDGFQMGPGGGG